MNCAFSRLQSSLFPASPNRRAKQSKPPQDSGGRFRHGGSREGKIIHGQPVVVTGIVNVQPPQEYLVTGIECYSRENGGGEHRPVRGQVAIQRRGSRARRRRIKIEGCERYPSVIRRAINSNGTGKRSRTDLVTEGKGLDRGIPTEDSLAQMRVKGASYLVGTPKGRLTKLEQAFLSQPWACVRPGVLVPVEIRS